MSHEPMFEPYDGYDPKQNELLTIPQSPLLPPDPDAFLNLQPSIAVAKDVVRIYNAMDLAMYVTANHYACVNPVELDERWEMDLAEEYEQHMSPAEAADLEHAQTPESQPEPHVPAPA